MSEQIPLRLSQLQYLDYIALICHFDDSQWIRMGRCLDQENAIEIPVNRDFTTACCETGERVEAYSRSFLKYKSQQADVSGPNHQDTEPLSSYLYNPACYVAFGHTDSLGLVLLDDIDTMMEITADIASPIEQATLAFCPSLASFNLPTERAHPFCELHELLASARPSVRQKADGSKYSIAANHAYQDDLPLIVVTRYKINGLAALGHGLLFQEAIFQAIAARILRVLDSLADSAIDHRIINAKEGDLSSLKCVLLDGQGSEDVLSLLACKNYSVAISIVASLRTLTFGDLFEVKPQLIGLLAGSDAYPTLVGLGEAVKKVPVTRDVARLRDNHIFSKTYTTLGATYRAFGGGTPSVCTGCVEAFAQMDASPGHLVSIERLLESKEMLSQASCSNGKIDLGPKSNVHRFQVGRHDYSFDYISDLASSPELALPIESFFLALRSLYELLKCNAVEGSQETGLLDMSTSLVIPFPRVRRPDSSGELLVNDVGECHLPLMPVLELMRRRLFRIPASMDAVKPFSDSAKSLDANRSSLEGVEVAPPRIADFQGFDLELLRKILRRNQVPYSIRRTIAYLYQNFSNHLADPFLFDSVLDLYDTLATLYHLLTYPSPTSEADGPRKQLRLDVDRFDELEGLLRAIQNAMMHRTYMSFPNLELRDMAVDFRGGLNRIIAAADVPLKCGLGLLRWAIENKDSLLAGAPSTDFVQTRRPICHRTVGGVTMMTFQPRSIVRSVMADRDQTCALAYVEMNIRHLFDPAELVHMVHETFHVLVNALGGTWVIWFGSQSRRYDRETVGPADMDARRMVRDERLDEITVGLFVQLMIFGDDAELCLCQFLANYSVHPISRGDSPSDSLRRFVEVLVRAFFVYDLICTVRSQFDNISTWPDVHPIYDCGFTDSSLNHAKAEAFGRFEYVLQRFGPLFPKYAEFWQGSSSAKVGLFAKAKFDQMFVDSFVDVGAIWQLVLRVYKSFCKDPHYYPWGTNRGRELDHNVAENIEKSLKCGRPVLSEFPGGSGDVDHPRMELDQQFDTFFIVCRYLRVYMGLTYGTLDLAKGIFLNRDTDSGTARFDVGLRDDQTAWNLFQLDDAYGGLYCSEPALRRDRLRWRITLLKTLWDLSTRLRARRLSQLLVANFH